MTSLLTGDKCILILGCFDTKGEVFSFLRTCILSRGERVIMINTGVLGTTNLFPIDFESGVVALEAGYDISDLRRDRDRGHAMEVMGKGAARIVSELVARGLVKAAIGMGGGGGTYIAISAMKEIPFGIPKFCLTTLATKDLSRQIGNKDITLMPSIVDVSGLNGILRLLVEQAAAAACAMANVVDVAIHKNSGSIAISMFGNTTPCVDKCTELLNNLGYEVLAFHATGVGGETMEALIREGCFEAVLDITTTELADELCNGILSAGPDRLTAATDMGIPQVVVPGCLDMVNFAHYDTVPEKYKSRDLYSWAPDVTLMRTNKQENIVLGKIFGEKLSRSTAPVTVVLPLKGLSQIDAEDGIFYRPDIDYALFESIKHNVTGSVNVIEADVHINDVSFAELLVQTLLIMIEK